MRNDASPAIGLKESRLLSLQETPKAATSDWTKEWMVQHGRESVPKELAAESLGGGSLSHLGGLTRVKESTVDGVAHVLRGAGRTVFKREFIKGPAEIGLGIADFIDIIPSSIADGTRMVTGPDNPRGGPSPYNYNISRAIGSWRQIEKPQHAVGAAIDTVHAAAFKPISDILRAVQKN